MASHDEKQGQVAPTTRDKDEDAVFRMLQELLPELQALMGRGGEGSTESPERQPSPRPPKDPVPSA